VQRQFQKEANKLAAKLAKSGTVKALYDDWLSRDIEGSRANPEKVVGSLPCTFCRSSEKTMSRRWRLR